MHLRLSLELNLLSWFYMGCHLKHLATFSHRTCMRLVTDVDRGLCMRMSEIYLGTVDSVLGFVQRNQ